jgi:hypothetical protein
MRALTLCALAVVASACWAQTPPISNLQIQQAPAKQLLFVDSDGMTKKAPNGTHLRLHTEMLPKSEKVGDVLRRNGLSEDQKTMGMLKRLNPTQDFTHGEVPAGTKLDLFVPKTAIADTSSTSKPITFDTAVVAKWAVRDQVFQAANVKKAAYGLPRDAYNDRAMLVEHRKVVSDIDTAAKLVEAKADSLTAADLAVAKYEIQYANLRADAINRKAAESGNVLPSELASLKEASAATQAMIPRLMSGQSPLPLRRVKVNVLKRDTQEGVKGLQVYVLPAGILDFPSGFTEEDVQTFLTRFSFVDETSPSTGNIAVFDTRIWIGPKLHFKEMARLVRTGRLTKFRPIDDPGMASPTVELVFRAPDDVVQP